MGAYEDGFNAGLEAAAKEADYWGSGSWKFQGNGRKRFDSFDCQNVVNTTSRAIAEDIRKLKLCEDKGCPNHGTPHVCVEAPKPKKQTLAGVVQEMGRQAVSEY